MFEDDRIGPGIPEARMDAEHAERLAKLDVKIRELSVRLQDEKDKQITLLTRRIAILQKGLEEIANNCVLGPSEIGPLHGAGMADGIYIQAKIATQTLKEAEECE
jgi:hypothetical protein